MRKTILSLFFVLSMITATPVKSEVDTVVLKWDPGFCNENCAKMLARRLQGIHDVAEVRMEGGASQAVLRWRPNKPFSFQTVDNVMRYVGVRLMQVFVTVRGTIQNANKNAAIVSIGDNTSFLLGSPLEIKTNQAAALQNYQSYVLKPETRNQLLLAQQEYKVVTIEGLLLLPERGAPLFLIIQNMSIPPSINGPANNEGFNTMALPRK